MREAVRMATPNMISWGANQDLPRAARMDSMLLGGSAIFAIQVLVRALMALGNSLTKVEVWCRRDTRWSLFQQSFRTRAQQVSNKYEQAVGASSDGVSLIKAVAISCSGNVQEQTVKACECQWRDDGTRWLRQRRAKERSEHVVTLDGQRVKLDTEAVATPKFH